MKLRWEIGVYTIALFNFNLQCCKVNVKYFDYWKYVLGLAVRHEACAIVCCTLSDSSDCRKCYCEILWQTWVSIHVYLCNGRYNPHVLFLLGFFGRIINVAVDLNIFFLFQLSKTLLLIGFTNLFSTVKLFYITKGIWTFSHHSAWEALNHNTVQILDE